MESSSWWLLDSWRWSFKQSLWDMDFEPEGLPIKKMVKFLGRWQVFIQIRSPAMIAATRMLRASIWNTNEDRTWLRWVLDWYRVVCWRNASRSKFRTNISEFAEKAKAKINVCWDDESSFLNLSFLSSLSAFFSIESVSRRFVRIWMFPESELRVASDEIATLFEFGGAILLERMCFSVRSLRNFFAMPLDCGTEKMTGILSW